VSAEHYHNVGAGAQAPTTAETMAIRQLEDIIRRNSVASSIIQTQLAQNANYRNSMRTLSLPNIHNVPGGKLM